MVAQLSFVNSVQNPLLGQNFCKCDVWYPTFDKMLQKSKKNVISLYDLSDFFGTKY